MPEKFVMCEFCATLPAYGDVVFCTSPNAYNIGDDCGACVEQVICAFCLLKQNAQVQSTYQRFDA